MKKWQKQLRADLRAMLKLLKPKKAWCQGSNAEDKSGNSTDYWSPKAVRHCMNGAALRVTDPTGRRDRTLSIASPRTDRVYEALNAVMPRNYEARYMDRAVWNDMPDRKHRDVLNLIHAAHEKVLS